MEAVIVLGSNWGDREIAISRALKAFDERVKVKNCSDIYETPDCLGTGKRYLNMVVSIETEYCEEDANKFFKALETRCGRNAALRRENKVPLDIDIVIWNGEVRRQSDFKAPYFQRGYRELSSTNSSQGLTV